MLIILSLLAALHLDVLQTLVLNPFFPDALLRVTGEALSDILDPACGLGPVFASSGFDHQGIRSKLSSIGIPNLRESCILTMWTVY
jgi:hypothetical protein